MFSDLETAGPPATPPPSAVPPPPAPPKASPAGRPTSSSSSLRTTARCRRCLTHARQWKRKAKAVPYRRDGSTSAPAACSTSVSSPARPRENPGSPGRPHPRRRQGAGRPCGSRSPASGWSTTYQGCRRCRSASRSAGTQHTHAQRLTLPLLVRLSLPSSMLPTDSNVARAPGPGST